MLSRRNLLVLGAAGVGYATLAGGASLLPGRRLAFEPVGDPAGFRRLAGQGQGVSVANAGLVGLAESTPKPAVPDLEKLCAITFQGGPQGRGALTIASFSDFFCPYCRELDAQLHDLVAARPEVSVVWHQVPLLGRASQLAARGALAAMQQGAFDAYQARLIRTSFVPTSAYMRDFATSAGLDPLRFLEDMRAPQTEAQLIESAGAFAAFGFVGTPGLVVGRTLVNGVISPRDLRSLIDLELDETGPLNC